MRLVILSEAKDLNLPRIEVEAKVEILRVAKVATLRITLGSGFFPGSRITIH